MARNTVSLAWFFARLAVKEHFAPKLHVRPLVAELFLTENCNLKCISCACWRTTTKGELSGEEWKNVIDQLVELGVLKLNFTGGEPLVRSDAVAVIRHARDAGARSLHLNSNAILLDKRRREALLEAGVRSFNVSIDGPEASTHEAIRGVAGSFDKTITNLRALVCLRNDYRLKIRMNFTVMQRNVRNLPRMALLAQELGIKLYLNLATSNTFLFRDKEVATQSQVDAAEIELALRELEKIERRDRRNLPRFSDLSYMKGHFSNLVQRGLPCAESQLKLLVHSDGRVGGCWGHDPHSNIRQTSLRAIVDSAQYRDEHARLFRKDCVGCGSNYSLNLRWRPATYLADLGWRLRLARLA